MRRPWVLILALAGACSDEEPSDACSDAPVVTWENFGEGFMLANCQACHATAALARHGAPAGVVFDTSEDVARWSDRILARAASEMPTMPPGGGTEDDERELLRLWLECYP